MGVYIQPRLTQFSSVQDLDTKKDQDPFRRHLLPSMRMSFDKIPELQRAFIVGEPGMGKSRLTQELAVAEHQKGKKVVFLDLKTLGKVASLETFLQHDEAIVVPEGDQPTDHPFWRSAGFELINDHSVVLCLDALDEVRRERLPTVIKALGDFMEAYPQVKVYISCREHHLKRYQARLPEVKMSCVRVHPFEPFQVRRFLEGALPPDQVDVITSNTMDQVEALIQVPRYLEMLVEYVGQPDSPPVRELTREDLFEHFIYRKLEMEADKEADEDPFASDKKAIVKRCLETLALVMEIYQTTEITEDELMTIREDIHNQLFPQLFQQVPRAQLFERTALKVSPAPRGRAQIIAFENAEVQEYLAAKALSRMGQADQAVYDLATVPETDDIHPAWMRTLHFLTELCPELVPLLLGFAERGGGRVQQADYHALLASTRTDQLSPEQRQKIFTSVFDHYQERRIRLLPAIAEKLSYYFEPGLELSLVAWCDRPGVSEKDQGLFKSNVAEVVSSLFERGGLGIDRAAWRQRLLDFIQDARALPVNGVRTGLQQTAITALCDMGDETVLTDLEEAVDMDNQGVADVLLAGCMALNPDAPVSLRLAIVEVKKRHVSVRAMYLIDRISSREGLLGFLQQLGDDEDFLLGFLETERSFERFYTNFFGKLEEHMDDDFAERVQAIFGRYLSSRHRLRLSQSIFLRDLFCLVQRLRPGFMGFFLKNMKLWDALGVWSFGQFVGRVVQAEDVAEVVDMLLNHAEMRPEDAKPFLLEMFWTARKQRGEEGEKVYQMGREHFPEDYKIYETPRADRQEDVHDDLMNLPALLENGLTNTTMAGEMLVAYAENQDQYDERYGEEGQAVIRQVATQVLNEADMRLFYGEGEASPDDAFLSEEEQRQRRLMRENWTRLMPFALSVTYRLQMDTSPYRAKMVDFIPFAGSEVKPLLELLGTLSAVEQQQLQAHYEEREELAFFRPESFLGFVLEYRMTALQPLVEYILRRSETFLRDRLEALRVLVELQLGQVWLQEQFEQYWAEYEDLFRRRQGVGDPRESGITARVSQRREKAVQQFTSRMVAASHLAGLANELLITKYQDLEAVKWRCQHIADRGTLVCEAVGGSQLLHMRHEFLDPLQGLSHERYKPMFQILLDRAFTDYGAAAADETGHQDRDYAGRLFEIVLRYTDRLKVHHRSFHHLHDLEKQVQSHEGQPGASWFAQRLVDLRRSYMWTLSKPRDIGACVREYNRLKKGQELDIRNERDLFELVYKVFDEDLRRWIESEGAYKILSGRIPGVKRKNEDYVQKTIASEMKAAFMARGIRGINIIREEQLIDDKRLDFVIWHGFIGPIIIELKMLDNDELTTDAKVADYKKKFIGHYIEGKKAPFALFAIFQVSKDDKKAEKEQRLKDAYADEQERVRILHIDCR